MAEVNTSMYATGYGAQPSAPNALGQMAQMAQTQNAMNQNRLFQQQFAAHQAIGRVMQVAIDPQTGAIDYNKAAVGLSTNPATAYIAPEIIKGWTQNRLTEAETMNKTLDAASKRFGAIGASAAGLVSAGAANGNKVDRADIIGSLALLKGQGLISDDDQTKFLLSTDKDPSKNFGMLLKVAQQAQGAEKTLANTFQAVSTPAGGFTQLGTRNAYGNTFAPTQGGTIEHSPTPAEMNAPQPYTDASGKPMSAPRAAVMPMFGGLGSQMTSPQGMAQQGANLSGGTAVAPQASPAPINGKPGGPGIQSAPANVAPNVVVPPAAGPVGAVPTGLTPYKADALKEIATKYEPALNDRTAAANSLQLLMSQVRDETNNFKTGGGASGYMKMGQLAQALGIKDEAVDKLSNGDLASTQAANKLFMQVGSMVAANLVHAGGGRMTQTEWSKILSEGAANIDLDPKAISKIFGAMREVTHYTGLESQAFQAAKQRYESGNYDLTNFQNDWQKNLGAHIANRSRPQSAQAQTPANANPVSVP